MMFDFYYRNPRLMLLTVCLIAVSGLSSLMILPRMEDPKLVERAAFVNTFFPGADPSRVESLVSEKIEDKLSEIEEIKEIRSTSREGLSAIAIELRDEVLDAERVWSRIRDRLNDVTNELPEGAMKPEFVEMDFKAFAMLVALKWDQPGEPNYAILRRWTLELEDRFRAMPGTEKVQIFGEPDEEILVSLDPEQLAALGLSVNDVSSQIRNSDSKLTAGQMRNQTSDVLIEVTGELDSLARIESMPIYDKRLSSFVRLSDLATVTKSVADPPKSFCIIDGVPAITLGVFVRPNVRIDHWAAQAETVIEKFSEALPTGVKLEVTFRQNDYVSTRLSTLMFNLLLGASAVFVVILVLMGWRNAVVVSLALPLASLMVLSGMRFMDIPIHQMSVTGLIIALGLLIDNAIVIVDEVTQKLKKGASRAKAISESVSHLMLPLFGSTLTTALAFGPIALMPGPAGEFVGSIAVNVILAIFSSFFLAMTILPTISAMINPFSGRSAGQLAARKDRWWTAGIYSRRLAKLYHNLLALILRRPWIGILLGIALPIAGFVQFGQLQEQFFPPADRNQLNIEIELGVHASLENTIAATARIRKSLLEEPEVNRVDWFVGESAPTFYYNLIARRKGTSQYAQAMVELNTFKDLKQIIHRLQKKLDHEMPSARILVRQLEQGPPFDAPIEIRIFGPDLKKLRQLGNDVRRVLVETPGVIHTRSELNEVLPKIALNVNEENARAAGLDLSLVARQLNGLTEGSLGGSVVEATEELPVRVRVAARSRSNLSNLASLDLVANLPFQNQEEMNYRGIPLMAIADINLEPDYGTIQHLAGRRLNEIQVYIPAGVLPATVLERFKTRLGESGVKIPPGYSLLYGGEAAKRDEAVSNLLASVFVLVVLMMATLVMSFSSFRLAGLVAIVAMLSVGLGVGALWIFGFPFGFMAIVGTMGLMGVAINDTIVVLAAIRGDELARTGDKEAVRQVVGRSTRHIISTSLTTMAGFMPLMLSGGGFWPPLAVAIAGGVGGATVLALVFVPACYVLLMCPRKQQLVSIPLPERNTNSATSQSIDIASVTTAEI